MRCDRGNAATTLRQQQTIPNHRFSGHDRGTDPDNDSEQTMSGNDAQSSVDRRTKPRSPAFDKLMAEMVADQAPRVFAVVLEFGEQTDAQIVAWGMTLDGGAYMTTVDGRNQFVLAEAENALRYVPSRSNITPHIVWATPGADG
nr:hypothetical protein [Kibdelosporangium sp. MJ126-NF4]